MADKKGKAVKMNPVAVNIYQIIFIQEMLAFNESVKKENQHSKIWESFTINPRKCNYFKIIYVQYRPVLKSLRII